MAQLSGRYSSKRLQTSPWETGLQSPAQTTGVPGTNRFAPSNFQAGWYPRTGTTGATTGTTAGEQWWVRPTTPMPEYEIPEAEIGKLARERLSTEIRPLRRGLRETLTESQSAATGPMRAYLMERALRGFSGGLGGAVQRAREYGRGVATEKAQAMWKARINAWMKEGRQKTTGTTTGTTAQTQASTQPRIQPGVYNVGGPYKYYAKGGPVNKRGPYVVGEEGPEVFVPNQSGTIIPNPKTQKRMGKMQFNFRDFLSRQYGGRVQKGVFSPPTTGLRDTGVLTPPTGFGGSSPAPGGPAPPLGGPTAGGPIAPRPSEITSQPSITPPGIAPPETNPLGPRAPGLAALYETVLKRRRRQTPMRTLI